MERPISRRNSVRNRNKSLRVTKRSFHYDVSGVSKQNLTPLQRLQKFKRLQERQAKVQQRNPNKPRIKRVTFADEMTSEAISVNGSHDPDTDKDEKILKPRKSILSNEQDKTVMQNGSNENGSVSENGDNDDVENGYDEDIQNGEVSKPNKRTRQKTLHDKRESTPIRQSLLREAKTAKETTPKPETPAKRELRQREITPMKTIPKPETPSKRESKPRGTPSKVNSSESNSEPKLSEQKYSEEGGSDKKIEQTITLDTVEHAENEKKEEESVVIIEESINEDSVVIITESEDGAIVKEKAEEKSFFSAFRRSSWKSSLELKDACEASSSSVICLDSPIPNEEKIVPTKDIKGRKPINSFSRFPGRNVSITSLDNTPLKRKADDSFEEDRKRFAGETASGSEKSPGWNFFSPSFRVWTPSQNSKTNLPTSTPFHKMEDQDSMAVNYDSKTKLDLDDSMENEETSSSKQKANKWCKIM